MPFADLISSVPAKGKTSWLLQSAGAGLFLAPKYGLIPQALHDLYSSGLLHGSLPSQASLVLGGGLGLFYTAKGLDIFKPKQARGIWEGNVFIPEKAFWTSFLVTGRPGAGKTSGAIMPTVEQIIPLYLGPDLIKGKDENGKPCMLENEHARIGGLVLEVKGEFYEMVGHLLDASGRNVYEDFLIIRPDSKIPVAKYRDVENGNFFYLNGQPCSTPSDAGRLLINAQADDKANGVITEPIRPDIFSCEDGELTAAMPKLRALKYPVHDRELCFLGWRRDGDRLVRISHTPEYHKPAFLLDKNGKKQYVPFPKELEFLDRVLISNGLVYNLVDSNVGADEAAGKLTTMASMAGRGEKSGGENVYWQSNAQKIMSASITLHRTVHPNTPAHCGHIYRMVADDKSLKEETALLGRHLTSLRAQESKITDPDKKNELRSRKIEPLERLTSYITGEWVGMDDKTKGIIKTVVSNTFSSFVLDPALNETFCATPTFDLSEATEKGRIFCLVPGQKYKNLAKVFGTGLNLDFQANALARLDRSDRNKNRPLLRLADEFWNWAISGGAGGGDAHFLSLCRAARCINVLATQNYDQFVEAMKRDATTNFLGQFGVFIWLQNFNKYTNDFAEELMEKAKREKFVANQSGDGAHMKQEWVEKKLYTSEDFVSLASDEAIVFDGSLTKNMAQKTKLPKSRLTHPDEQPNIAKFMRRFLAGSIEQALWRQNRLDRLDPKPQEPASKVGSAPAPTSSVPDPIETKNTPPPPTAKAKPQPSPQSPPPTKSTVPGKPPAVRSVPPPIGASRKLNFRIVSKRDASAENRSAPSQGGSKSNEFSGPTPREIDTESEAFKAMWSRLTLAAAEVAGEDEYGIQKMIREAGQKMRTGESTGPLFQVGPKGISVGKAALHEPANPIQTDSLDKLAPRENAPNDLRMENARAKVFEQKAGPPPTAGNPFFEA